MYLFAQADLEQTISTLAKNTVAISAVSLFILTVLAILISKRSKKIQKYAKLPLFILMAGTMAVSTIILSAGTIYLNVKSDSGGPVHWHAGIEFWACDTELNLRDPGGALSNKVGTWTFHEHNDKFMHLEGVVVDESYDASLNKFMTVTGGYVTDRSIGIPLSKDSAKWPLTGDQGDGDQINHSMGTSLDTITQNGQRIAQTKNGPVLQLHNGDTCANGQPGEVQVFVYTYNKSDDTYYQTKLDDPRDYHMREESALGPPSDCVIVEFGPSKDSTDKLCEQYGIKDVKRCVDFGVHEFDPKLCNIREVNGPQESRL